MSTKARDINPRQLATTLNLHLLPCGKQGNLKRSYVNWKDYQTADVPERVYTTYHHAKAWGILVGPHHDLVVIDTDSQEAEQWAQENLPDTSWMVRTKKGFHRYYRYPHHLGELASKIHPRLPDGRKLDIDIKSTGYVMAPGSLHPDGHIYEATNEWKPTDVLPTYDPSWIPTQKKQVRQKRGVSDTQQGYARALSWLRERAPAIEGSAGRAHTYGTACEVARMVGDSAELIYQALEESGWNARCNPPWDTEELYPICSDAAKEAGNESKPHSPDYQAKQEATTKSTKTKGELAKLEEVVKGLDLLRAGDSFYLSPGNGEVLNLDSQAADGKLLLAYVERYGTPPKDQTVEQFKKITKAKLREVPESKVARRVAEYKGLYYLDLCQNGKVVEMSPTGWRITQCPQGLYFQRSGQEWESLPLPTTDGDATLLGRHTRLQGDDLKLAIAWTLGALRPDIPCPWILCEGSSGSGKTTEARILRTLIDPGEWNGMVGAFPNSTDDLLACSASDHVLAFDNLDRLTPQRSDALCRVVTGASVKKRALYTNNDSFTVTIKNPGILTGLGNVVTKADLADRMIVFRFLALPKEAKRKESDIRKSLQADLPSILGGLLDAFCAGLAGEDEVSYDKSSRMMDFAAFVTAAENALPWAQGDITRALCINRSECFADMANGDTTLSSLLGFMEGYDIWEGHLRELLEKITQRTLLDSRHYLPTSPRALSTKLSEFSPILEAHGIRMSRPKRTKTGWIYRLERLDDHPEPPNDHPMITTNDHQNTALSPETKPIPPKGDRDDQDDHTFSITGKKTEEQTTKRDIRRHDHLDHLDHHPLPSLAQKEEKMTSPIPIGAGKKVRKVHLHEKCPF